MRTMIVYDSQYGNTEKIAQTIANVLSQQGKWKSLGWGI